MELIKGPNRRVHVLKAQDWAKQAGTDFWFDFTAGAGSLGAAGDDLATNFGWTLTSLVTTAVTATGDLFSSSDIGTPGHQLTDASGDLLLSPQIFGSYQHSQFFQSVMGYVPTRLCVEFWGALTVNTGAETTSGFGFSAGSPATATNQVAYIYSDATNFACRSTPGTGGFVDTGAARDAAWHRFKLIVTATGVEWFIDDVSQGTITVATDLFPCSFAMHALTTNRPAISSGHVWYE